MCGRLSLFVPPSVLEARFDATVVRPVEPRYNVAPGDDLVVVRNDAPDEITTLEWGLVPHWVDDPSGFSAPINARAETVADKPSFREAFERRRCLVLADGFYEWAGDASRKQPYRVVRSDERPFALAGLWERWEGAGAVRETATIITTAANDRMAPIHDRMPVVLAPDEEARWLGADDAADPGSLLDPFPAAALRAYPVAAAVNDPANDHPGVVEARPRSQTNLEEFT